MFVRRKDDHLNSWLTDSISRANASVSNNRVEYEKVKKIAKYLGEEINDAIMRLAWVEPEPKSIIRRTQRIRELFRELEEAAKPLIWKIEEKDFHTAEALRNSIKQIKEMIGFDEKELEKWGDDAKAYTITNLARAQQEILYLLYSIDNEEQ